MPRTIEEQAELDMMLMKAAARRSPDEIRTALQAGANWNTDIMGATPLAKLMAEFEQRISWPKTSRIGTLLKRSVMLSFAMDAVYFGEIALDIIRGTHSFTSENNFFVKASIALKFGAGIPLMILGAVNTRRTGGVVDSMLAIQGEGATPMLADMILTSRNPSAAEKFMKFLCASKIPSRKTLSLAESLIKGSPAILMCSRVEEEHTPLHMAVKSDNPALARLLLRYGHDPKAEAVFSDSDNMESRVYPKSLAKRGSECARLLEVSGEQWLRETSDEIRGLEGTLLGNYDRFLTEHQYSETQKAEYIGRMAQCVREAIVEAIGSVQPKGGEITPGERLIVGRCLCGMEILCEQTKNMNLQITKQLSGLQPRSYDNAPTRRLYERFSALQREIIETSPTPPRMRRAPSPATLGPDPRTMPPLPAVALTARRAAPGLAPQL